MTSGDSTLADPPNDHLPLTRAPRSMYAGIPPGARSPPNFHHLHDASRAAAQVLHPHRLKEEELALPPLGLLPALARDDVTNEMLRTTTMTDRLKSEIPAMLAEHRTIADALGELERAAHGRRDEVRVHLARKIISHARMEEEVMYPAAALVGEYIKAKWRDRAHRGAPLEHSQPPPR